MIKAPFFTIVVYALCLCSLSRAETTPMSQPLVEENETLISCEYAKVPLRTDIPVLESAQDAEKAKGAFNYREVLNSFPRFNFHKPNSLRTGIRSQKR